MFLIRMALYKNLPMAVITLLIFLLIHMAHGQRLLLFILQIRRFCSQDITMFIKLPMAVCHGVQSVAFQGGESIRSLVIAQSNPDYIYAGTLGNIYMTSNGGDSWIDISSGLPVANAAITGIAISDYDPQSVWVTFSGYSDGEKIYTSTDGGSSWINVSGTLPNIPVNCIVYQNSSSDAIYIGTDFGVFYKDSTMNDWVSFNNGLPNVIIDELEIQYDASKIRAATYGRGLWESKLNSTILYNTDAGVYAFSSLPSGCDSVIAPIVKIKNFGIDTLTSLTLNYKLDAGSVNTFLWSGSLALNACTNITLPAINVSSGNHTFTAYTSNPNGLSDGNANNDSKTISFTIAGIGQALPISEDFEGFTFPPSGWTFSLWTKSTSVGGFGNSANSAMIDFFNLYFGQKGNLTTDFLNFNSLSVPLYLSFDVAYARFDDTYFDTLSVKISGDCGNTWTTLWSKGGVDLATAPDTQEPFTPTSTQWRKEKINLSSFSNMQKDKIFFEGISGYCNTLYLDNINVYSASGISENNIDNNSVNIYPNPSTGEFFVDMKTLGGSSVTISIYDVVGTLIKQLSVSPDNTQQPFSFNLLNHAKGLYLIKIETDKSVLNRIITIM